VCFSLFGLVGHAVPACRSSQLGGQPRLKLRVNIWRSARFPIGLKAVPRASDPGTSLEGVSLLPLLEGDIPASKTLEMFIV
jgi:hypothetical protein